MTRNRLRLLSRMSKYLTKAMSTKAGRDKENVQEEIVTVDGVRTPVLKLGDFNDVSPEKGQRILMLIIPGNPGVPHYYEDFMHKLYDQSDGQVPVWTVGHACHLRLPPETLNISSVCSAQENVCGLEAQIAHKIKFISEHIPPDVTLILIGHSIGCYIILNMLTHLTPNQVLHCFLLFPTLERMAVSPNGQFMTPFLCNLRWVIVFVAMLFIILPKNFRRRLIQWWYKNLDYPDCAVTAILETLTPWSANFVTFMAKLEMKTVVGLQKDLLKKHMNIISLYYGANDLWVPRVYYYNLIKEFPEIDARLCDLNLKHAFVLSTQEGQEMANIVWMWAQSRYRSKLPCTYDDDDDDRGEAWTYVD